MGKLTRTQIINQGITLAGKSTSSSAFVSLVVVSWNAWLRSTYKGWLWPFLLRQASAISLPAGTTSITIGASNGGITDDIDDLFDPIYVWTSDYSTKEVARVRQIRGGRASSEPAIQDPSKNRACPREFKAREGGSGGEGSWILTPYCVPDKNYLLALDYKFLPQDTLNDSDIPYYKNDRTMIYAAKVCTLEHMKAEDYGAELQILASMTLQDFGKDAAKTGTNDNLSLDPIFFR